MAHNVESIADVLIFEKRQPDIAALLELKVKFYLQCSIETSRTKLKTISKLKLMIIPSASILAMQC